jgi:hypothetical protein
LEPRILRIDTEEKGKGLEPQISQIFTEKKTEITDFEKEKMFKISAIPWFHFLFSLWPSVSSVVSFLICVLVSLCGWRLKALEPRMRHPMTTRIYTEEKGKKTTDFTDLHRGKRRID